MLHFFTINPPPVKLCQCCYNVRDEGDLKAPFPVNSLIYSATKTYKSIYRNSFEIPRFPSQLTSQNPKNLNCITVKLATLRSRVLVFLKWVLCVSLICCEFDDKMTVLPTSDSIHIREVWNDNLENEFALIRDIIDDYPYIAMDTEFPGIVLRPLGNFKSSTEYHFHTLKANVDLLKLIQLGLTFSDEVGNLPTCGTGKYCVWQFNFREFNVNEDVYAHDSIELLSQSGMDFKMNNEKGIDANRFSELLMSSGIVLNDNVHWVTFHSGYDFGYLLKLLTCQNLPDTQAGFFHLIKMYFPNLYDIKHLMRFSNSLHGGLNKLAELLDVERVGICHQAGSDSLLTSCTFMKLKENFFNGSTTKYAGVLYGLGVGNGHISP